MFTGIIESMGKIARIESQGSNLSFYVQSDLSAELKVDQSLSHSGVCLTVESIDGNVHRVTAIAETLAKTNLSQLQAGDAINLERCLRLDGRLDGHIVQGHCDTIATCSRVTEKDGSWEFDFQFEEKFAPLLIEKGSVAINGVSLTCFNVSRDSFTVAIIPYTYEYTNFKLLRSGDSVNIEFDMIGKYVNRLQSLR